MQTMSKEWYFPLKDLKVLPLKRPAKKRKKSFKALVETQAKWSNFITTEANKMCVFTYVSFATEKSLVFIYDVSC